MGILDLAGDEPKSKGFLAEGEITEARHSVVDTLSTKVVSDLQEEVAFWKRETERLALLVNSLEAKLEVQAIETGGADLRRSEREKALLAELGHYKLRWNKLMKLSEYSRAPKLP